MPLLGKIVVIKRNGADGTEFPLTASCLFGRKLDCDIRIQLPQVSKEHCRIELNENKELILTNLSSVNPTRINGEILQQSERLKHGDLITVIDRSFRFEYPPPPTPKKKRLSASEKGETVKVLQDQQVRSTPGSTDKKKSEHPDTCLKDGSNLPSSLDQSVEVTKGDGKQTDSTMSPFTELYHMVKRDLASKSPWKAAAQPKSPLARPQVDKEEPKKVLASHSDLPNENDKPVTPKSAKKNRRSSNVRAVDSSESVAAESSVTADVVENPSTEVQAATPAVQETPGKQKRRSSGPVTLMTEVSTTPVSQKKPPQVTPQKFSADEVAEQILLMHSSAEKTPKSPKGRRSGASQPQSPAVTPKSPATPQTSSSSKTPTVSQSKTPAREPEGSEVKHTPRTSPRENAGKRFQVQDVVREIVTTQDNAQVSSKKHKCKDLPVPVPKRKRVSFGGQLSPELFDKRLPPNSPLRRGATPGRRSLGISQKPQSLLRRASTIGLMNFQLDETVPESPSKNASPRRASSSGKSPKASPGKTPSPAKKSPSTKGKTPSPKNKTPPKTATPSSSPATPKTPKSAKRVSNASIKTPSSSDGSILRTPTVQGRFSITRIPTPSPDRVGEEAKVDSVPVVDVPQEYVTPKNSLRRSSMKASARKTPKSALKSALEVIRSRRSGASRANLKVVSSWADIVKFGQVKPQVECGIKKTTIKQKAAKQTKVTKPKTPARRLKDVSSTGHADSPATIVIGKASMRAVQAVGAAPKIVPNIALFKKNMKMDEDLSGVADMFKTPAKSKRKIVMDNSDEHPETPLGVSTSSLPEMSVMNTPEESGEMLVSPISVASTAKLGRYNSEAVTRLLQGDQDVSLIEDGPQMADSNDLPANEIISELEMPTYGQIEKKEAEPQIMVQTPQRESEPLECLTGVKKLMRTPKQRSDPIEDLRGKLLKTPKERKPTQEENFEGVKELLNTPKQKGTPVDDMAGLKRLMKTPEVKNSPVVCAVGLKKLMKTPKDKTQQEEDLTGVKQLMQTPKLKGEPVEHAFGVKRLMKTPKQKGKPVEEDLIGIKEMMKTPKQRSKPVEDLRGIQQMMKTPKQKGKPVEEDLTGIKEMMKTPKQKGKPVEEDLTGIKKMKTPKEMSKPVEEDLMGVQQMMKTPKQKSKPVEVDLTGIKEMMKTPKQKGKPVEEDLTGIKEMKTPKEMSKPVEEDLTGVQQMMKTPKQKSKPVEEDLTGIKKMKTPKEMSKPVEEDLTGVQQMMKTPKQKSKPVEEDLTGIKKMKTPKEMSKPVEEDLTGVQQMMKTPKQKSRSVEEDLTGIQQMMKTPKQKSEPIEDLTGMKRLLQTPKQKGEPVENEFGISRMMKTPKQKGGKVEEDLTGLAELVDEPVSKSTPDVTETSQNDVSESVEIQELLASDVLAVEDVNEESEDKENICPVESMQHETEAAVAIPTIPLEEEVSSVKMTNHEEDRNIQEQPVQESLSEAVSPVVDATPSLPTPKKEEKAEISSPVKKTRGGRVKTVQKSQKIDSDSPAVSESQEENTAVETVPPLSAPVKGRRGKMVIEEPVPMPSPVRKSARGRVPKRQVQAMEANHAQAFKPSEDVKQVSECPLVAVKPRRGKKAEQDGGVESVLQVHSVAGSESTEPSAEVEASLKSPAPAAKTKRGRKGKQETEDLPVDPAPEEPQESHIPAAKAKRGTKGKQETEDPPVIPASQEPQESNMPEATVEKEDVAPESVELQSSVETDAPVKTNTRTRRGRPMKKDSLKTVEVQKIAEPTPTKVESDITSSDAVVVADELPQIPVVKPGRGRRAKPGALKALPVVVDPKNDEPEVAESEQKPALPEVSEDVHDHPATAETSAAVTETEEHVGTMVKNVRGGRRTKQPKAAQVSEDAQENVKDKSEVDLATTEESETLVIKSVRGKRTAVVRNEPEGPVKRGRRAAAVAEVPPPVAKPSRGRRAAVKAEQEEVPENATAAEEPAKDTSKAVALSESEPYETPVSQASSDVAVCDVVEDIAEIPAKRGRGRYAKKAKALTNSVNNAEDPTVEEAGFESKRNISKKAVNWNSDLVAWKNIEEMEPPAAEEEPQPKKERTSRKKAEPAAKPSTEDTSVSELPTKGRRGRVAKKQDEPLEKSDTTAEVESEQQKSKKKAEPEAKDTDEDTSVSETKQSVEPPTKGRRGRVAKKQDEPLEKSETAAEEESEQQKSKQKAEPEAKDTDEDTLVSETKQAVGPPAKGRRGRVAKKQDEPIVEKSETSAVENTPVVRRGRAGASLVSKPDEVAACPKRGSKRKEIEVEADETPSVESLPKRRKGKAISAEPHPEEAAPSKGRRAAAKEAAEETPEAESEQSEPTTKKNENRPARGKRKAAQEDSAPAQSEDPVSEPTTRRGTRGQKKTETDTPSAPVRRTRRK